MRARGAGLIFLPVIYGLALAAAFRFKRYLDTRTGPAIPAEAHQVFGHPFAMALTRRAASEHSFNSVRAAQHRFGDLSAVDRTARAADADIWSTPKCGPRSISCWASICLKCFAP